MRRASASRDELDDLPPFRFDSLRHAYYIHNRAVRHITELLSLEGLIKGEEWFTEESSERGRAVHDLTARHDLGALDVETCVSPYRGYLLGHVKVSSIMRPEWEHIEEPCVSYNPPFGGRADRVGKVYGAWSVLEVKSGQRDYRAHAIQLALQALLWAPRLRLPAESIVRYAEYLRPNGKGGVYEFTNRHDFVKARSILARFC